MWLDSELGDNLIQAPIEELKSLRGTKVSKIEVELEPGSMVKIEGSSGGQVRMYMKFFDLRSFCIAIMVSSLKAGRSPYFRENKVSF